MDNKKPNNFNNKKKNYFKHNQDTMNNSLQNKTLSTYIKEDAQIELSTVNGETIKGKIVKFDSFTILLQNEVGDLFLLFKNNIVEIIKRRS